MSGQRDGWASASSPVEGSRQGLGASAAAAGGTSAAAPPSSALSEISRVSTGSHHSHHSIYSQRSRWSTAATTATTRVGHMEPLGDLEPPLPEEGAATFFSGSSSTASGDMGPLSAAPSAAAQLRLGRRDTSDPGSLSPRCAQAERRTGSGSVASAGAGQGSPTLALQQSASGGTEGSADEAAAAAADSSTGEVACGTSASGSGSPSSAGLPPRLIVFHPDGSTFGIGVDKQREKELQEAAEAAAAQRRQRLQQQAANGRAGGGAGGGGSREAGRGEGMDSSYAGWRAIFNRQKGMLIGLLVVDCIYLIVLLALRLVWGKDETPPNPTGAAQFFVGSHPESTSVSYLAGSLFTDCVALYGTANNYASVITLFIVWSVVLGAFAILEMPLLFIIIRLMLLVAAFQLRFSMARLRNMLPPTSHLANLFRSAGRGVAAAGSAVARPFRRRSAAQPAVLPVTAPAEPGAATGEGAAGAAPASPSAARSAAARDRLRQHDDAMIMRVVREMQRQQTARALQVSGGAAAAPGPAAASSSASGAGAAAAEATAAGSPAAGGAAGGAQQGSSSQLGQSSTGSSLDRLYSQLMQDIAAVSNSPSSTRERRRQRRRERDSRRQQALAAGTSGGASSSRRGGGSGSEGEGEGPGGSGAQAAGPSGSSSQAGPSRRQSQQSGGSSAAGASSAAAVQVELAGSRSRSAGRRSAPGGASGSGAGSASGGAAGAAQGTPTWDDLVALLALHHSQQQQLRRQRQRQVDVVPLVSLEAPPPLLEPSEPAPAPGPVTPALEDAAGSGVGRSGQPSGGDAAV